MGINPLQQLPSYAIDIPDPTAEFMKGQLTTLKMDEAIAEREAKKKSALQIQAAMEKVRQPGAKFEDYANLSMILPKDQADNVLKVWETRTKDQQQASLMQAGQVFSALNGGQNDVAIQLLTQQAEAARNSGKEAEAKAAEDYAKMIGLNPAVAKANAGMMIALMPGGKDVIDAATKAREGDTDAQFRSLMAGAETPEDVFKRIPALAGLGVKGLEHAERLLAQERLKASQEDRETERATERAQEKAKTAGAISLLNSLFQGQIAAAPQAEGKPVADQAAGDRPIMVASIDGTTRSDAPLDLFRLDRSGELTISPRLESILSQKGVPAMDETKANALGLTPDLQAIITGMAKSDPKGAASLMTDIIKAKIKASVAASAPAKLSAHATMLVESGLVPGTPEFRKAMAQHAAETTKGAGRPAVSIDTTKARGELGKQYGEFAQKAMEGAQNAADVASDISLIVSGLRGMGGGPVAEFKAWAGQYAPAGTEWGKIASMQELASTVQAKIAPAMRAAGSGATSDMEMKAFMRAIPTIATSEHGRVLMEKYANKVADRAQARAEIVNDFEQSGKLPTPREIADKMKQRFSDKFFDDADRRHFGMGAPAQQPVAPPANVQSVLDRYPARK